MYGAAPANGAAPTKKVQNRIDQIFTQAPCKIHSVIIFFTCIMHDFPKNLSTAFTQWQPVAIPAHSQHTPHQSQRSNIIRFCLTKSHHVQLDSRRSPGINWPPACANKPVTPSKKPHHTPHPTFGVDAPSCTIEEKFARQTLIIQQIKQNKYFVSRDHS